MGNHSRVIGVLALIVASVGMGHAAYAALIDFQLTATDSAGSLPELFFNNQAGTSIGLSLTKTPTQTAMSPGDVLEVDLFAPAGLRFVVTAPTGSFPVAPLTDFGLLLKNTNFLINPTSVAAQSNSAIGDTGRGTLVGNSNLLYAGSSWFLALDFAITGTVSFTELSARYLVPADLTASLTPLSFTGSASSGFLVVDPGSFVRLEAIPATEAPEPATLSVLGAGLAGLAALRRRRATACHQSVIA
jgi:hypothetical protein